MKISRKTKRRAAKVAAGALAVGTLAAGVHKFRNRGPYVLQKAVPPKDLKYMRRQYRRAGRAAKI